MKYDKLLAEVYELMIKNDIDKQDKKKIYQKKYYIDNKEKIKERMRLYHHKRKHDPEYKEMKKKYFKEYYKNNKSL